MLFQVSSSGTDTGPAKTKTRGGGGKRKSTRQPSSRQKSLRLDENDEPSSMGVIREEDVVDLSMIEHNRSTPGRVLNNSTNIG